MDLLFQLIPQTYHMILSFDASITFFMSESAKKMDLRIFPENRLIFTFSPKILGMCDFDVLC